VIRVLLAEDHSLVRAGLVQLLAKAGDIEVVGVASDGQEAVELAAVHEPDVVLMDLVMPRVDGIEATRRIHQSGGTPPAVVVLTSFSDRERIIGALQAGAAGYLLKEAEPEELFRGVRDAAGGRLTLAPRAARAMADAPQEPVARQITEREREVLGHVHRGLSNKQIARELGITEKTVKAHLTRIFERIGVTDRTQAALWAERQGLTS
jgi:DNA-binding NarL/FixJ family response regulator